MLAPSLSFKFIANACGIFVGSRGTKILCDPWLMDGVFEGSWCHFEKLKTTVGDVSNVDAIYISHLHPDHFDEREFIFDKLIPIIVLDHGPNFLIKRLLSLGYKNLIKIQNLQSVSFREFRLTMFSPFAKHNFHDAVVGNLIDSALLLECNGVSALNANDNTPSIEAAKMLNEHYGPITLAMLNYNAAGPYPSCFDNLTEQEKKAESEKILLRNFSHIRDIVKVMNPQYVLPFAGAYVIGGKLYHKNSYLGTTTWDECAAYLNANGIQPAQTILLRENDVLDIEKGKADKEYEPIDVEAMRSYIERNLAGIQYPYELEEFPNEEKIIADIEIASARMKERMSCLGISSRFAVILDLSFDKYQIYPTFRRSEGFEAFDFKLECRLDIRLLRNILDKRSHWNNAEIGTHISFYRSPNNYDPDLHIGLQFFHL